jgi:hypothetical protein
MLLCHHDRRNMECLVAIMHRGRPFIHSSTSPSSLGLSWTSYHIEHRQVDLTDNEEVAYLGSLGPR